MPQNALFSFSALKNQENIRLESSKASDPGRYAWVNRLWDGHDPDAPFARSEGTRVSSHWDAEALYFDFSCTFDELSVDERLGPAGPTARLWEYDVVELFLRPRGCSGYYEIEVGPLGQWLDLFVFEPRAHLDWSWRSRLSVDVQLDRDSRHWAVHLRLPFEAMATRFPALKMPEVGDVWRLNLFRIAGVHPGRRYFAWRPTFTTEPDFHVPSAFGNLVFLSEDCFAA
jgi:hypothetical protein